MTFIIFRIFKLLLVVDIIPGSFHNVFHGKFSKISKNYDFQSILNIFEEFYWTIV